MNVLRRLLTRCSRNEAVMENSEINQYSKPCEPEKATKINQAIKSAVKEATAAIGKTFAAAVVTTIITVETAVIDYANASRQSFAIGGEWIFVILLFCASYYITEKLMSKNKKATQQK